MKTAFLCAGAGWVAALVAHMMWPWGIFALLVSLAAIGLTVLWALHLAMYSGRIMVALWAEYVTEPTPLPANAARRSISRRNMIWVCASALSLGIVAAVWLPATAFAAGSACGEGRACPDSAPKCCSRSQGKCCNGNWACTKTASCHDKHADARAECGSDGTVWACS